MKIQQTVINQVQVLLPQGRIDSLTAESFDQTLQQVLDQPTNKLLIDFASTDFISSAGLRVLLMAAKKANKQGCKLRLCNMNEVLKDIFDVSGFVSLFSVDDAQSDSLSKFG